MKNEYDTKTKELPLKGSRGGARAGSGRKGIDDSGGAVVTTVRLTAKQRATFEMLGGIGWLRAQLDAYAGEA